MATFLWHDYETFGTDARYDRPAQFAAIRTDLDLNVIGEPIVWYCHPPTDRLPHPKASLITGLTPQMCLDRGVPECEFAERIHALMSEPDQIVVGYNSLDFDDEVSRFLFWRNLLDPYRREWANGNSRWDLLPVLQLAHALRTGGVQWPAREDGHTSFRLEDLAHANGLEHDAHDALSDVMATIGLARLARQAHPDLWAHALGQRTKQTVRRQLDRALVDRAPLLYINPFAGAARGFLSAMVPLAWHPTDANCLVAWDLRTDPSELADRSTDEIRTRLFTKSADLPEGVTRPGLVTIKVNRCPIILPLTGDERWAAAQRWGMDPAAIERHRARLPVGGGRLDERLRAIYARRTDASDATAPDVDTTLYGTFVESADRRRLDVVRADPGRQASGFDHPDLSDLVRRYRARHAPATLTAHDLSQWEQTRRRHIVDGTPATPSYSEYLATIDDLAAEHDDERSAAILHDLRDWGGELAASAAPANA
ncbi:exodeoxyribonuclease I [Xylanimonas ulmi]|uniref:Exodeoxyribonuclease I n=1 Tax=Xylanimonas ulmi TaxID=228973 RepID=A0A4Q7M3X5_9MICO|nr:exodeoxyribonuclease I [Xylanibacterium ulmi]RZS62254.1 exodeoxyribonuclease I subunit C [Xylanibacterium ulmi]